MSEGNKGFQTGIVGEYLGYSRLDIRRCVMKRIIIVLFGILVVAFSSLYAQEMSQPAKGDGTNENPYLISSAEELRWFANEVNENGRHFICAQLIRDIDLNPGFTFDENGFHGVGTPVEWKPIGYKTIDYGDYSIEGSYAGVFDGDGYVISGLYITENNIEEIDVHKGRPALFAKLSNIGVIKNIGVENSYISVDEAGGICGTNIGTIYNCYNAATIVCSSDGVAPDVGGICALNDGNINHCFNIGQIRVLDSYFFVGGICGTNFKHLGEGLISDCYNAGLIIAVGDIGGICGRSDGLSTIRNCYNIGNIKGLNLSTIGGICGNFQSTTPVMSNCYNVGVMEGGSGIGEICGLAYNCIIYDCYYLSGSMNLGIYQDHINDLYNHFTKAVDVQDLVNNINISNAFTNANGWKNSASYENGILKFPTLGNDRQREIICYTVKFNTTLGGTINRSNGTCRKGTNMTVIATPHNNYRFVNWTNSAGQVVSSNKSYTFTVTSDLSFTANFEKIEPNHYSVDIWATTGGRVSNNGGTYAEGTQITVQAFPDDGFHFMHWTDANGRVLSHESVYTFTVTSNTILRANFEEELYFIHVIESPDVVLRPNNFFVKWNETAVIHAELIGEGNYTDEIRLLFKRGENGSWETQYGSGFGDFYIDNVQSDIYVKAERYAPVANETIKSEDVSVCTRNGNLYVQTSNLQQVNIIALNGTIMRSQKQSGLQCYEGLKPGVYLVRVGGKVLKVLITQ